MQLCCVFLLLFAQQSALTHGVWHASGGDEQHGTGTPVLHDHGHDHDSDTQGALCAYHLAFGSVLGGHHGVAPPPALVDGACLAFQAVFSGRLSVEPVPALSRGPPLLL